MTKVLASLANSPHSGVYYPGEHLESVALEIIAPAARGEGGLREKTQDMTLAVDQGWASLGRNARTG